MRTLTLSLATIIAAASLGGCIRSSKDKFGGGSDGSILTSIGGLDQADRDRNPTYTLICDVGGRVDGAIELVNNEEFVVFKAAQIKSGDGCAMEVRAPVANANLFTWRGIKADGTVDVGLFYGSSKGTVDANRKLALTLYKVYTAHPQDPFTATAKVKFDLGTGVNAGVMPTDATKTSANIICVQGTETRTYSGNFEKTGDLLATLTFELSVSEMKGLTCNSLVIVDSVQKVSTFEGAATDINFPDPQLNTSYAFPASGEPYVLKPVVVPGTNVNVSIDAGTCLRGFNVDTKTCLDRRSVILPFAKNYMIAKVKGRTKTGTEVTYFVGAGEGKFDLLDGNTLNVDQINKSLLSTASDAEKKMFSFWSANIENSLFSFPFDNKFAAGQNHSSHLADSASLVDAVTFLDIDTVWVHGFAPVAEADLNAEPAARWLALVTAKKSGMSDQIFYVGGYDRYFTSSKAPATVGGQAVYLDMATLVSEMASSTGTTKWRTYGFTGGAMAPSQCQASQDYYVNELSQHTNEVVNLGGSEDGKINGCEVMKAQFSSSLGGATIETKFYRWDWHKV